MSDTILVRVLGAIPPHEKGSVIRVRCDSEGTPLELQWRRRLKDAERDGCCEIVQVEEEKVLESTDEGRQEKKTTRRRRESKS